VNAIKRLEPFDELAEYEQLMKDCKRLLSEISRQAYRMLLLRKTKKLYGKLRAIQSKLNHQNKVNFYWVYQEI
jgi:hypothetical protein